MISQKKKNLLVLSVAILILWFVTCRICEIKEELDKKLTKITNEYKNCDCVILKWNTSTVEMDIYCDIIARNVITKLPKYFRPVYMLPQTCYVNYVNEEKLVRFIRNVEEWKDINEFSLKTKYVFYNMMNLGVLIFIIQISLVILLPEFDKEGAALENIICVWIFVFFSVGIFYLMFLSTICFE